MELADKPPLLPPIVGTLAVNRGILKAGKFPKPAKAGNGCGAPYAVGTVGTKAWTGY